MLTLAHDFQNQSANHLPRTFPIRHMAASYGSNLGHQLAGETNSLATESYQMRWVDPNEITRSLGPTTIGLNGNLPAASWIFIGVFKMKGKKLCLWVS